MTAMTAAVRSTSMPVFGSRMREQQLDILDQIVRKHLQGPGFEAERAIASSDEFTLTTQERSNGLLHWEHGHLVAALDTLNSYQRDRRGRSKMNLAGARIGMKRSYKNDPRTRFVELMKRWLTVNAAATNVSQDEVRRMIGMCREIMANPVLFPARNERSFMKTIAEVYQHLDVQLRELLEKDKTCAELAQRVLSLSRNLVSDAIGYLLVGPTDLKKTDDLPSLEVVSLWASLPSDSHPLPGRIDPKMQRAMRDVWQTAAGALIADLLRTRWCVRLFEGAGACAQDTTPRSISREESATPLSALELDRAGASIPRSCSASDRAGAATAHSGCMLDRSALLEQLETKWNGTPLKQSGLAGSFRKAEQLGVRDDYLAAVKVLVDITYLIGEALVIFQQISDGLGDYGTLRVAKWLHPFLAALSEKVLRLKGYLESLNKAVNDQIVTASARGYAIEKPVPSQRMGQRALLAVDRAVIHDGSHVQELLKALEDLRQRSAPERLPQVMAEIGDACMRLGAVLSSPDMQACVGDIFPSMPRLADVCQPQNQIIFEAHTPLQIVDVTEVEGATVAASNLRAAASRQSDLPEVDFLEPAREPKLHAERPCASNANHDREAMPCGNQGVAPAMDAPQVLPKGVQARPNWPLQLHRNASDHAEVLHAAVIRLMPSRCGPGFYRHDRRSLRLQHGKLDVFDKGSAAKVKTSIRVKYDVEECSPMLGGKRLSLVIRRVPPGADKDSGVWNFKSYFFEFASVDEATAFHHEINQLLNASM